MQSAGEGVPAQETEPAEKREESDWSLSQQPEPTHDNVPIWVTALYP